MGKNAKFAHVSMQRAIEDSGLTPEQYQSNPRIGGILGQADTSATDVEETCKAVEGQKRMNSKIGPYRVTRTMASSVSAVLATAFKLQGTSYSISSACSTSAHCIGTGMEQIQLGKQVRRAAPSPPKPLRRWARAATDARRGRLRRIWSSVERARAAAGARR